MSNISSVELRRIAQTEIEKLLPGIAPEPLAEYLTSVVRQWSSIPNYHHDD